MAGWLAGCLDIKEWIEDQKIGEKEQDRAREQKTKREGNGRYGKKDSSETQETSRTECKQKRKETGSSQDRTTTNDDDNDG